MNREVTLRELKRLETGLEALVEDANAEANRLLGEYLGDPELVEAFDAIKRWYS